MAVVTIVLLLLVALMVGAARVGLAGYFSPQVRQQTTLLAIFGRNFWLTTDPTYRVMLQPQDAPRLFAILDELSGRIGVVPPHEVAIEMNGGAWVQLKGYRRGAGRTILGVGYDLFAALSEGEVEAVLAHEMAHAKLVQRGLSRWMNKGLARLGRMTGQLFDHAAACRQNKDPSRLADMLAKGFDALTARAARLVATYSRQDEFEADRGAAEIYGAGVLRSALTRLEALDEDRARLPWSERVARIQPGESFSQWLVGEIARSPDDRPAEIRKDAVDPYSTHPSLHDRLAALGTDATAVLNQRPGIELLAEPDRVAGRLLSEIQRVLGAQERRDTKDLARSTRKLSGSGRTRPLQWLGGILILVGAFIGIAAVADGFSGSIMATCIVVLALGLFVHQRGRYRDRSEMPVPTYGKLTNPRPPETMEEFRAVEDRIAAELKARVEPTPKKRDRLAVLVSESYSALGASDYLRAHVAARLALEINSKYVEAALGYAVASAGLGDARQSAAMLTWVRGDTGLRTPNTRWATAWALTLLEDWSSEGFLAQLHDMVPRQATFASLLALAQFHRGKLQSAVQNAKSACVLEPANFEHTQLLANILLASGRAMEAAERMKPHADLSRRDPHAALLMVRINLMLRDARMAGEWAAHLRATDADGRWLISLGNVFESARMDDQAAQFYNEALAAAYYPAALIGLARIDATRGDKEAARGHLLSALDFDRPAAPNAQGPGALFHDILGQLTALAERRESCTAWVATFSANPSFPLSERSLIVCATSQPAAEEHLQVIVKAMQPSATSLVAVQWRKAAKDQQPIRPVHPGVQFITG